MSITSINSNCSVYVVNTPYHFIIAHSYASFFDLSKNKYLFVIPDFKNADLFISTLNTSNGNPFQKIKLLHGRHGLSPVHVSRSILVGIRNKHIINQFFRKYMGKKTIFVFNDSDPEQQYFFYRNKSYQGTNIYIEDGSSPYNDYVNKEYPKIFIRILRIFWGKHYDRIGILGTYHHTQYLMVLNKQLLRSELKNRSILSLPNTIFWKAYETSFIQSLLNEFILDDMINDSKCLLILPISDYLIKNKQIELYSNILNNLIHKFKNVCIKHHPRESNHKAFNIKTNENIKIFPQSLPSELIYMNFTQQQKIVIIGDISTSLLNAKHIIPQASVISINKFSNNKYPFLIGNFEKIGILCPKSYDEFIRALNFFSTGF